jgi:hypothetical protein
LLPLDEGEALQRTQIRATELEVNVKQTLLAQQQANRSLEQTALAGTAASQALTPQPSQLPESTVQVLPETAPVLTPEVTTPGPPAETPPAPAFDEAAFQEWKKTAKILLYEDMTARLDTIRYVKSSLDEMGLPYKDDGSAYGWLLDDLANGPADGGQWDLIIIAAEDKAGVKADFFSPALKAIDQNTPVILEVWYLDGAYSGSASGILARCGVVYENNWVRIPPSGAALFELSPNHPILNQPNSALNFTSTTNFWWDPTGEISYDVGDLIKLAPDTQATLLLGTMAGVTTNHGTSTVCLDDLLTMQTFSSHVLTYNSMSPLWQNYIENALRARFNRSN